MSNIHTCESIKRRIENHSHYGPCFNGDVYTNFSSKREDLRKCRECYDEVVNTERELIDDNYKNKNLEQKIENLKITAKKEFENTIKKYNDEEKIKSIEYENKIENIIKTNEINKTKNENELNLLDIDISNLKIEIEQLKEKYEKEIDYIKKNKLNEIKNEYKLKLIKYQNEKEKEKDIDKHHRYNRRPGHGIVRQREHRSAPGARCVLHPQRRHCRCRLQRHHRPHRHRD